MILLPGFIKMKNSYFLKMYKLFASFLLPIILIGVVSYLSIREGMIREADRNYQGRVDSISTAINDNFTEYVRMSSLIFRSVQMMDTENKLINLYGSSESLGKNTLEMIKFRDLLAASKEVKESLDSIFVYFNNTEFIVSNEGVYEKGSFFERYNHYEKYSTSDWETIKISDKYVTVLNTTKLYKNYIKGTSGTLEFNNYSNVIPLVISGRLAFGLNAVIVMNVKESFIYDLIRVKTNVDDVLFIVNEAGETISSTDKSWQDSGNLLNILKVKTSRDTGGVKAELSGKKYVLYKKKAVNVNWMAYTLVAEKHFYHRLNTILGLLLLAGIILLAAGLFTAYIYSGRLYSPIKNLVNAIYDTEDGKDKSISVNEFEVIKENLKGLRTKNEGLAVSVGKIKPYMHIVKSFIACGDHSVNEQELLDLFMDEKIKLNKKYFLISEFVLLYKPEFIVSFTEKEQVSIKNGILQMAKDVIRNRFEESIFIDWADGKHIVIINTDDSALYESYCRIAENFYNILNEDRRFVYFLISVSSQMENPNSIPEEFININDVLETTDINTWGLIIKALPNSGNMIESLPTHLEEKLDNIVIGGQINEIEHMVNEVFDQFFQKEVTIRKIHKIKKEFYEIIGRIAERHSISIMQEYNMNRNTLLESINLADVRQKFTKVLIEMAGALRSQEIGKRDTLVNYLDEHYMDENMCIESMASDLNFHPNYLSRLFKKETGQYFSDYLSQLRIEKAKEFIMEKSLTIDEISKKVGIVNRSTFNRLYKKYTGVSPAAYRMIRE